MATILDPRLYHKRKAAQPMATHFRLATCSEVMCPHYLMGWKTVVPSTSPQADYIRRDKSREFKEQRVEGGLSEFVFHAGQKCFREHQVQNERPPLLFVQKRDGDVVRQAADRWLGEFNEETFQHEERRKRGDI